MRALLRNQANKDPLKKKIKLGSSKGNRRGKYVGRGHRLIINDARTSTCAACRIEESQPRDDLSTRDVEQRMCVCRTDTCHVRRSALRGRHDAR